MREYQERKSVDATAIPMRSALNGSTRGGVPGRLLQMQRDYGNSYVRRLLALARKGEGETEIDPAVEAAITRSRGGGQALDGSARMQMEQAFGADFSGVRVHTGAEAHSFNKTLNAVAFTTGQDIFFRQSAYDPGSMAGKELLAHELTHVVQQGGGSVQGKLVLGAAGDRYEQEADSVAKAVVGGLEQRGSGALQPQCACGGGHTDSAGECAECRQKRESSGTASDVRRRQNPGRIQRDPFDAVGPDNGACREKVTEDGAVCQDHANTACSVGGAGAAASGALIGAGVGSMVPLLGTLVGGAIGAVAGGIGGALAYGKCVEKVNAACRARTRQALQQCDRKFSAQSGPAPGGAAGQPAIPEVNVEDLPKAQ